MSHDSIVITVPWQEKIDDGKFGADSDRQLSSFERFGESPSMKF
jgi:hypothetical protein